MFYALLIFLGFAGGMAVLALIASKGYDFLLKRFGMGFWFWFITMMTICLALALMVAPITYVVMQSPSANSVCEVEK